MSQATAQLVGALIALFGVGLYALAATPLRHLVWPDRAPEEVADRQEFIEAPTRRQATLEGFAKDLDPEKTVTGIRIGYDREGEMHESKNFSIVGADIVVHDPSDAFVELMKLWGRSEQRIVLCIDWNWELSPGNLTTGSEVIVAMGAQDRAARAAK